MNDTESLSTKLKEMKELMSRDTPEEFLQQQELLETLRELGVGEQALRYAYVNVDFTERAEPSDVIETLEKLSSDFSR